MADEREVPLRVVDETVARQHAVAFALFAGPDATYVAGEYRPSPVELELADRLLSTLEAVGWAVKRLEEPPPRALPRVVKRVRSRQQVEEVRCPDGGTCHHECARADRPVAVCWRTRYATPLSGVYPGDEWPAELLAERRPGGPRT